MSHSSRKIAHEVLRKQLTEGQVDELLRGEVTYDDVAGFLDSGGGGASVLRTILGHESGKRLLAGWLLKPSVDGDIESKGGTNELFSLLTERVGLKLTADRDLARARRSTLRYLLVNEFRMDYEGEPPAELDSVAAVPRSECKARIQKVVKELRERHADAYADGARQVQARSSARTLCHRSEPTWSRGHVSVRRGDPPRPCRRAPGRGQARSGEDAHRRETGELLGDPRCAAPRPMGSVQPHRGVELGAPRGAAGPWLAHRATRRHG